MFIFEYTEDVNHIAANNMTEGPSGLRLGYRLRIRRPSYYVYKDLIEDIFQVLTSHPALISSYYVINT